MCNTFCTPVEETRSKRQNFSELAGRHCIACWKSPRHSTRYTGCYGFKAIQEPFCLPPEHKRIATSANTRKGSGDASRTQQSIGNTVRRDLGRPHEAFARICLAA